MISSILFLLGCIGLIIGSLLSLRKKNQLSTILSDYSEAEILDIESSLLKNVINHKTEEFIQRTSSNIFLEFLCFFGGLILGSIAWFSLSFPDAWVAMCLIMNLIISFAVIHIFLKIHEDGQHSSLFLVLKKAPKFLLIFEKMTLILNLIFYLLLLRQPALFIWGNFHG